MPIVHPLRKQQILADYRAGVPLKLICWKHKVGREYPRILARRHGLPARNRGDRKLQQALVRDYVAGVSAKEMARRYGVSPYYARRLARRLGIPARSQYAVHGNWYRLTEGRRKWLQEQAEKAEYSRSHYAHNNPRGAMIFDGAVD